MSNKRSADDAGLGAPENEENHEENDDNEENEDPEDNDIEDGEDEYEEGDENDEGNSDRSDDSSESSTPDDEALCGMALSWLEDRRIDGLAPQAIFEALGMKVVMDNMALSEQWELLEKVVTSETVSHSIFRSLFTPHRTKLPDITTLEDVVELIRSSNNIVILTGAGVSVSCGIPDFRSPNGLYAVIEEKYNLPEPQCLFDIHYLRDDPHPFFEFAREIFPGQHKPSPTHYFIKELAQKGKLLRNYTQNIDTLEKVAGIDASKLVNCHGSFATASCVVCKRQVDGDKIRSEILNATIPLCTVCNDDSAFMKPDIVFFGEALPDRFDDCLKVDIDQIDLLLVMGSSLKVKPVAFVPEVIKADIPQILINRELVAQPHEFDYAYLGDCDAFVLEVSRRLGWTLNGKSPDEYPTPPPPPAITPSSITAAVISTTTITTDPTSTTSTTTTIASITTTLSPSIAPISTPTLSSLPLPTSSLHDIPELDLLPGGAL